MILEMGAKSKYDVYNNKRRISKHAELIVLSHLLFKLKLLFILLDDVFHGPEHGRARVLFTHSRRHLLHLMGCLSHIIKRLNEDIITLVDSDTLSLLER
jgi:hypothetical protein